MMMIIQRNAQNQRYTKQLFWEEYIRLQQAERTTTPKFTLYTDKEGLINLGKEYINDADPSGYKTCTRFFENYDYWTILLKCRWFREALDVWNAELEAKLYSEGLAKIRELAKGDDQKALAAARFLANGEYKKDRKGASGTKVRGRPSSIEIEGHVKNALDDAELLREDAKRIGLVA